MYELKVKVLQIYLGLAVWPDRDTVRWDSIGSEYSNLTERCVINKINCLLSLTDTFTTTCSLGIGAAIL